MSGYEQLLDERERLRRQIDWLCREIPRIGSDPDGTEDFEAYSYCPTRDAAKRCLFKMDAPDAVCAECWKRESANAVKG